MMLSILSCVCWQCVYLLWRNVYLGLLPIFGLGCLLFWYWAAWAACKFWRLILSPPHWSTFFLGLQNTLLSNFPFHSSGPSLLSICIFFFCFLSFPWLSQAVLWLLNLYIVNSQDHVFPAYPSPLNCRPPCLTPYLALQLGCLIDTPKDVISTSCSHSVPTTVTFVLPSSQLQWHSSRPKPLVSPWLFSFSRTSHPIAQPMLLTLTSNISWIYSGPWDCFNALLLLCWNFE